jgi:histidinol-phosphate/aromatic aminotransferase/cobyric acid decarboxylase-like protein
MGASFSYAATSIAPPTQGVTGLTDVKSVLTEDTKTLYASMQSKFASAVLGNVADSNRVVFGNNKKFLVNAVFDKTNAYTWKNGPYSTQPEDFTKLFTEKDMEKLSDEHCVSTIAISNPNNPSGDFMKAADLMQYIRSATADSFDTTVIVDETYLPFIGEDWKRDSIMLQQQFLDEMENKGIRVWVVMDLTKVFAAPGLTLNVIVGPNSERVLETFTEMPTNNNFDLRFLGALDQTSYLGEVNTTTKENRSKLTNVLQGMGYETYGWTFVPWVWVDVGSQEIADMFVAKGLEHSVNVISGKSFYNEPTYIQIPVNADASLFSSIGQ